MAEENKGFFKGLFNKIAGAIKETPAEPGAEQPSSGQVPPELGTHLGTPPAAEKWTPRDYVFWQAASACRAIC